MVIEEPRPKKLVPFVTYGLILANVVIFIITLALTSTDGGFSIGDLSGWWFEPAKMFQGQELYTLLTAAFLHANWVHLLSNMYFLWIFGDDCEDIMGHVTYLVFYLFAAVFASFFFALVTAVVVSLTSSTLLGISCVGASGAIFGVMAGYAVFLPNRTLLIPGYGRMTAKVYIIFYAIMEIIYTVVGYQDPTAHAAHVGGFLAGIFFAYIFKRMYQEKIKIAKTDFLPAGRKRKLSP
jgi:membrane associated rhomboid family serine protease